jgi:hypothetical protein
MDHGRIYRRKLAAGQLEMSKLAHNGVSRLCNNTYCHLGMAGSGKPSDQRTQGFTALSVPPVCENRTRDYSRTGL